MSKVIRLRVILTRQNRQEEPGIYRILEIPDTISFFELHCMLQLAMNWGGVGSHEFKDFFDSEDIICDDHDWADGTHGVIFDSRQYKIKPYFRENSFTYYNYEDHDGNGWLHILFVEGVYNRTKGKRYPVCADGKGNSPLESFGGWEGYDLMKKKRGEYYQLFKRIYGCSYDARYFNLEEVNFKLLNWRQYAQKFVPLYTPPQLDTSS